MITFKKTTPIVNIHNTVKGYSHKLQSVKQWGNELEMSELINSQRICIVSECTQEKGCQPRSRLYLVKKKKKMISEAQANL